MSITIGGEGLAERLVAKLNELSNRSSDTESSDEEFNIFLRNENMTPAALSVMVQLLNHPLPRKHSQNDEDRKWDWVNLEHGSIQQPPATLHTLDDIPYCTADDMHVFFTTLMSRTRTLWLQESPDFVSCLTRFPPLDLLEVSSLRIHQDTPLSTDEFERLGEMIQRSNHLTSLHLALNLQEAPLPMLESLVNATNIQHLRCQLSVTAYLQQMQSSILVEEGISGVGVLLLQNPQSRLQYLALDHIGLQDHHFIAIAQALPESHLQRLDVNGNDIQSGAILEFAKQLPNIQSLKSISFMENPWWRVPSSPLLAHDGEKCCAALVEGLMENVSVEEIPDLRDYSWAHPHLRLLMHFLDLNRAGRRILSSSAPIPAGLWPHVLERAGTKIMYASRFDFRTEQPRRANAVYFLVQSCLIFRHRAS